MSAFDSALPDGGLSFPAVTSLPLTTLVASPDSTQKGLNAHLISTLDACKGARLIALPAEVLDKLCISVRNILPQN